MKKILLLLVLSFVVFSCKNSEENKTAEPTTTTENQEQYLKDKLYRGEFIYMADAAVLKGDNFIFGVKMDEMAAKLGERVKPIKVDEFDMVPVIVKGVVSPKEKDQEGWDQILTITEILEVSTSPAKADVKIQENKK